MDEKLNGTALKKIIENWVKIKDSFFANDLAGELIQKEIITPDQWIDIKSRPKTDPDKIDEFLCIVQKQKPAAHDVFVKILTEKHFEWNTNLNGASIVREGSSHEKSECKALIAGAIMPIAQNDRNEIKEEIRKELSEEVDKKIKCKLGETTSLILKKLESLQTYMDKYKEKELECQELTETNNKLQKELILQKTNHIKTLEMVEEEKSKLNDELQKKEQEYVELQKKLKEWKAGDKERLDKLKDLREEVAGLNAAKKSAEEYIHQLQQEMKELEKKVSEEMNLNDKKRSCIKKLEDDNGVVKKKVEEIEKTNTELRKRNRTLEESLRKSKNENKALETQLEEMRKSRRGQSKRNLKFGPNNK